LRCIHEISRSVDPTGRSEVKFKSAVKVGEVQKQADRLAQEHRELDARIQALNWHVELE
jgi:hypothetical protein